LISIASPLSLSEKYVYTDFFTPSGNPLLRKPFALPFSNRSLIVVPTSAFREPVKTINADALRADLPILAGAMQKAYSGLDTAARRGWDWNA